MRRGIFCFLAYVRAKRIFFAHGYLLTRRSVALNGLAATNPQLASSANAYPPDGKYQGATTIQGAR